MVAAAVLTSSPAPGTLAGVAVGLVVLVFVVWRQLQRRRFRGRMTFPIVLVVLGLASLSSYAGAHPLGAEQVAVLAVLLAFDAVGLGALRAYTVRLWIDEDGVTWRRGGWLTLALWVVGVGAHVVGDGAAGVGSASALLYLGLTLVAQRFALSVRARALART